MKSKKIIQTAILFGTLTFGNLKSSGQTNFENLENKNEDALIKYNHYLNEYPVLELNLKQVNNPCI